jgi:hypothetical protein
MRLCILILDGACAADDAIDDVAFITGEDFPWLRRICVVSRSALGRLTIAAAYSADADDSLIYEEGELAARAAEPIVYAGARCAAYSELAPPYSSGVAAMLANDVERRCFHMRALKELLRCNSSAIMLVAPEETCGEMTRVFAPYHPRVLCRQVHGRVGDCLDLLDSPDEEVAWDAKVSALH